MKQKNTNKADVAPAPVDITTKWYQDNVLVKTAHVEPAPAKSGQHSPGPFKNNGLYIMQAKSGRVLATIEQDGSRPCDVLGNLALFTAAPELLEACKSASEGFCPEVLRQIRAAIAKAEGRE